MYTSVFLVAWSSILVHAVPVSDSPWLSDYNSALKQGQKAMKPLAVVIGEGPHGWNQLCAEGKLGTETREVLKAKYVCLYVDSKGDSGQKLAKSFGMTDGTGLVISDYTGAFQAFRHQGELTDAELKSCLRKYANPERTVRSTDTKVREELRYYPPPAQTPVFVQPATVQSC